jgi:hypothetical protein
MEILSSEQVTALQEKYPTPKTAEQKREEARQRKREQRARDKATKETRTAMSQAEDIQQFWAESLKTADQGKLAEWQTRQEYVEALLGDIRTVLEGRAADAEFITDVADEIRANIKEHGITGVTPILLIGQFWKHPELLAKLTSGDSPSAIFATLGFLLAVDDYSLHKWEQFLSLRAVQTAIPQPRLPQVGTGTRP